MPCSKRIPSKLADASLRFSARVQRAGSFLLLAQEKGTKENAPRMPRPSRYALRVREVMPGFVERTSLSVQRTRAHRARDPADISVLPSPRQTGTRRSWARSRAPPSVASRQLVLATSLWLALRAAFAANIGNPADVSPRRRGSESFCFWLLIFLPLHRTEHRR